MAVRETKEQKLERLTQLEMALWANGRIVAGIDEVGRGPLAGPVVTACVSIPRDKLAAVSAQLLGIECESAREKIGSRT